LLSSLSPHPQPWQMLPLPREVNLALTSALQRKRPEAPSLRAVPTPLAASGRPTGFRTPSHWASSPPSSTASTTRS
jgi:hypothetical protein